MPIGSTVVYNAGDLILSTVSSSGNTFQENKIAAATSSIILFNSNGLISSQSLSSTTVGTASVSTTASYLVPTNSYQLTNLTASNIISIGAGSQFHNIYLQKPLVVGANYHRLHLGTRWYFDTTANVWTSSVQPNVDNPDWTAIDSMFTYLSFKVGSVTGSTTSLTTSSYDASERLRITTGGAILSTSGSDTELRIVNNDNANDPKITFYSASTAQWVVGIDDSDDDKFKINQGSLLNASNVITLNTGSNVGIGTTLPLNKLDVAGNISASNLTSSTISAESSIFSVRSTNHPLYLYDNATNTVLARVTNNTPGVGSSTDFILRSGSTDNVRLSTAQSNFFLNNNVGIGLNSPGALLHVSTGSTSPSSTHQVEISTAASKRILFLANTLNASYNPIVTSGDSGIIFASSSVGSSQCFFIAPWSATAGGISISGSGQVGIGTNDPRGTLHVVGNITASSITASLLGTSSWAQSASFISPSGNAFVQGGNSFGATATIGTNDANSLVLETNNTAQLTINSGGKFAIGSSVNPVYKFSITDTHFGSTGGSSSLYVITTQSQTSNTASSANDIGIYSVYNVTNFTASTALQNNAMYNALQILGSGSFSGSYRAMRNGILIANTSSLDTNASFINTYLTNQIATDIPSFSVPNWTAGTYTLVDLITGNSTGSITNLFMHQIGTPFSTFGAGGITVTNAYGVYISRQKQTNVVTNGYGIYQADTGDLNIFAGKTRIGSATAPVNTLDVNGNISASAITASLFSGSLSGSVFGTSSWATNSLTASSLVTANSYNITNLTASSIKTEYISVRSGSQEGEAVLFGRTTSLSSENPIVVNLGGTYSDTEGLRPKLKLYDDTNTNNTIGIGVSYDNQINTIVSDYIVPTTSSHVFWIGLTKLVTIKTGSVVIASANLTASGNISASGTIVASSFTGSFSGSINSAISSSYALSASFAPTNTNITASWATNALTASSLVANANYRINALTASGPIIYDNAVLLDYSSSNMPTTISVVIQNSTGSYNAAFFDYAIFSSSNSRAGTIVSTWNGGSIVFNETCTTDIGNTSQITMSVGLNAGNVQLVASGSSTNWNIKASARYI